jgi:PAS domain S-box-containing protein
MMRKPIMNFRGPAARLFLGAVVLALATLALSFLHVNLAATAFIYLVVILLLSLVSGFVASTLLSVIAAAALVYFFAPPIFDFQIDDPQDLVVVVAFLATSLIGTHLLGKLREEREGALETKAKLRRSEADLRESEREWREVFEHNPVMYFMVDAAGTVLNVNTFGAAQLGYSVADLVGQSVLKVFLEEDQEFVRQCVGVCLEAPGQSHTWEVRKIRKDGSVLWVRENAKALRRASDQFIVLIACEDVTEQKQTENALRQSEAYLAEAQHLSHTGSWSWDVRRQEFVYRSAEVYRLFGFDPKEGALSAQVFRERIPPEDVELVGEVASHAIREKGGQFEFDFRIILPDRSVRRIHSIAHAVVGSDGQISEIIGTHMDVTEQYQAREALQKAFNEIKKSEDSLRLVIDTIPAQVWSNRPDGAAGFLNQQILDYTGLSMDQALGWGWTIVVHPDDLAGLLKATRAAWTSGAGGEAEARLRRVDGEYRWFLFRTQPLRDETGRIIQWYGSATDIEDRKRTEVALRESEQRFRDYAETASDWLWETGPDHRVTLLSEHAEAAGVTAAGMVGLPRWAIASDIEAEPEKWRQHRATLDAHLPFRDLVFPTINRMGSPIYVRTSGKPFFDADGKLLGYRGVSTDITATIRADHAEQALRKAQAELAHVTRVTTLGELTTSIAHEINQPLAAIVANADACLSWLDRATPDLEAARRSVEWIIDDSNRASEVIRRVRALAKKTDIEKALLDINDIVREGVSLVQRELASNRVALRMELAPALPPILGDRVQLQQVIINLVMNGIEAMQSINDRPRELEIRSGQDERGQVHLTVADSGVGITVEDSDRLFSPFFTTKVSGLGMGLSICRSIVEAHDGRLWATANLPHGATFQFTLPVNADHAS